MADAAYEAAVKKAFVTNPLRSVLLIDDEFPTFSDLACGETKENKKKFAQKDRALGLYQGFRSRQMICDFENEVADLKIERFRKSDLIILDYHLGPGNNNCESSINLLRNLSSSKHFNTVIVYTVEPKLDKVWLEIMASLSGGWTNFSPKEDALAHWNELTDSEELPTASLEAQMQFAMRQNIRDLEIPVRQAADKELERLGVPLDLCSDIITAMIHSEMGRRAGKYASEPHRHTIGGYREEVYWIQTQNSFVTILQKDDDKEVGDKSMRLMSCLNESLLAWNPNLFQILVSEIQNILELEALATADELLREATTQTALWYYLLETLGCIDPRTNTDVKAPLVDIINKIVDGIRRRLSTDDKLLNLASQALLGELKDFGWTNDTWPERGSKDMFRKVSRIARTEGIVKMQDVFFRLNGFLSTELFNCAHLTTGTICFFPDSDEYFVMASPACDLMVREPREEQRWANSIHPLTAVVAISLQPVASIDSALSKATRAQHIFLERGEEKKVFKIVNSSGQPSYEIFFAKNEGRIRHVDGKLLLDVARVLPNLVLVDAEFEVIGQLRNVNATRVLHMTGQHLSRIGLDFLNMPNR